MCILIKNGVRVLAVVVTGVTVGLIFVTPAQAASPMGSSGCTGQPIRIETSMDPENDPVGFLYLNPDVDVTGSTVIRQQDGAWTIAPVGQVTSNVEKDTFGYAPKRSSRS
jgi:hypothetical protein